MLGGRRSDADAPRLRGFLDGFHHARSAELDLPETARDPALVEFSTLMRHGTNEPENIERRLAILRDAHTRLAGSAATIVPWAATGPNHEA